MTLLKFDDSTPTPRAPLDLTLSVTHSVCFLENKNKLNQNWNIFVKILIQLEFCMKMQHKSRIDLIYYTFLSVISIKSYVDFCKYFSFNFHLLFSKQKSNLSKMNLSLNHFHRYFLSIYIQLRIHFVRNLISIFHEIFNYFLVKNDNEYFIILASWLGKQMARVPKQFKSKLESVHTVS